MFKDRLNRLIDTKNSLVCIGLDTDGNRIPKCLSNEPQPLFAFNREIIQATVSLAAAFKINTAFYECLGNPGWELLEKTLELIPTDTLVLADAKRADIGNTSQKYAATFFETYSFDAITVSPYMGEDSVAPFLEFAEKGVFILCLTSNPGAGDFQYLISNDIPLYLRVAEKVVEWDMKYGNCGLVVGATHPRELSSIRKIVKKLPLLIPGIGTQGGNLEGVVKNGIDDMGKGALINSSRSIIYASSEKDFANAAFSAAQELRDQINTIRLTARHRV